VQVQQEPQPRPGDRASRAVKELVPRSDAQRRCQQIQLLLESMTQQKEKVLSLVTEAKKHDDHLALGYLSWSAYIAAEYAGLLADLNREDRRFAAFALSQTGMSVRAIAPLVGVGKDTVARDVAQVSHDATPGQVSPNETSDRAGLDGKTYPPAERKRRERPAPDAFRHATDDLRRVTTRLENIVKRPSFPRNREAIRGGNLDWLIRESDKLKGIIQALRGGDGAEEDR